LQQVDSLRLLIDFLISSCLFKGYLLAAYQPVFLFNAGLILGWDGIILSDRNCFLTCKAMIEELCSGKP
jgi:hypothetical protein